MAGYKVLIKYTLIIVFVLSNCGHASSQINDARKEYERFRKQSIQDYSSFRQKANLEYAEWMRSAWEQHQALPSIPKPIDNDAPIFFYNKNEYHSIKENQIPIEVVPSPVVQPQPLPIEPIKEVPDPSPSVCKFQFYGLDCKIRFNESQKFSLSSLGNESIAAQWNIMSDKRYDNTIRDCLEYRITHNLCDWAYIQLLDKLAASVFSSKSEQNLLIAFLLSQTGYKIRLAKSKNILYFLYASPHYLYDLPTFHIDDIFYYGYNCTETKLEIFNMAFPKEQLISFWIPKDQILGNSLSEDRIISSQRYPEIKVSVNVNTDLVNFYNTYPTSVVDDNFMTRWAMYANAPISINVKEKLYPQLRSFMNNNSQLESLNKLLNLIQTGLVYEYDDKVWGHDRAFFPEETLFYQYCDCEDRSILFSRLVRDILGLDVILVFYPGHLATAVALTENVAGDYILYNNRRFVISDPTYIGAPVGVTMPEMDNKTAKIILLNK